MEELKVNGTQESASKKERSAAHPALNIEAALNFVSDIHKNFRYAYTKRDDILPLIEGGHPRYLAASTYYGFLNREKDSYQVSDLYKSIANSITPTEKKKALLIALYNPALNKELIDKFDGDEIPKELKAHLFRFHRITEDAAPNAADVFIKSAQYCGVLESNKLNYKQTLLRIENPAIEEKLTSVVQVVQDYELEPTKNPAIIEQPKEAVLLPDMVNKEETRIRLTGGKFAYLTYPSNLTKTDIAILKKEIEQLELIVE